MSRSFKRELPPPQASIEKLEKMVQEGNYYEAQQVYKSTSARWSAEFGASRSGSPEFHEMLADFMYTESPETDMAKVSSHFVRGNNPKKFAKTLVNFMSKCYPEEDDVAIARGVLMYLSQGNLRDANILMDEIKQQLELGELELPQSELMKFIEYLLLTLERDAYPLMKVLRQHFKSSINRDPLFDELLDEVAEKFYNAKRRSGGLQGLLDDLFKMPMM